MTIPQPFSEDWVLKAQKGNTEAAGRIYETYHQKIFRYLYYRTGDSHAAQDLTADVFIKMIKALPAYQPRANSFTGWLFQIARNTAIDHARKNGLHPSTQLSENHLAEDDPAHEVERLITSQELQTALMQISEEQRDVIILRFIEDLPLADTAQTLHRSVDSIKGLQRRALLNLRQQLFQNSEVKK